MSIAARCTGCGKKYRFPEGREGQQIYCRECGEAVNPVSSRQRDDDDEVEDRPRRRSSSRKSNAAQNQNTAYVVGGLAGLSLLALFVKFAIRGWLIFGNNGGVGPNAAAPANAPWQQPQNQPQFAQNLPPNLGPRPMPFPEPMNPAQPHPLQQTRSIAPNPAGAAAGSPPQPVAGANASGSRVVTQNLLAGTGMGANIGVMDYWRRDSKSLATSNVRRPPIRTNVTRDSMDNWVMVPDPSPFDFGTPPAKPKLRAKLPTVSKSKGADPSDIIFPATPSPFVALGDNQGTTDRREIWNLVTGEKAGTISGLKLEPLAAALSPDGRYYAVSSRRPRNVTMVYDIAKQQPVCELFRVWTNLAFARSDRLVAVDDDKQLKVFRLPDGEEMADIDLGFFGKTAILSPGGKYVAWHHADFGRFGIRFAEVDGSTVVGQLPMPPLKGDNPMLEGMAFSLDGREFGAVYRTWGAEKNKRQSELAIWNLDSGLLSSQMVIPSEADDLFFPLGGPIPLIWLPGNQRFLVAEQLLLDRESGAFTFRIDPNPDRWTGKRVVVGPNHVTTVSVTGKDRFITLESLPDQKFKGLQTFIAQREKPAAPPQTPPPAPKSIAPVVNVEPAALATADRFNATMITDSEVPWQVEADPAETCASTVDQLSLQDLGGRIREVGLTGGPTPRAIVLSSSLRDAESLIPRGNTKPSDLRAAREAAVQPAKDSDKDSSSRKADTRCRVDVIDLKSGTRTLDVRLPYGADLVGVSPDGSQFLCWAMTGRGELHLYSAVDGQSLASWQPDPPFDEKQLSPLIAATLIANNRALTLNLAGRLVVWDLPQPKAIWEIQQVSQPLVSPAGRYLSYATGTGYHFVELETGKLCGSLRGLGEVHAAAYHPSGQRLALLSSRAEGYCLQFVDLRTGTVSKPFPVPVLSGFLRWCGDRYLLLDERRLVDIEQQAVVWTYEVAIGDHLPTSPDGRHWYVSEIKGIPTLSATTIPGPSVSEQLAGRSLKPEIVLQPGGACSLKLQLGSVASPDYVAELEQSLKQKLAAHQIKVQPGHPVSLLLTTKEEFGETVTQTYHKFGSLNDEKVTYPRKTMRLRVTFDGPGETGWEYYDSATNHAGFMIQLKPNQTIVDSIQESYIFGCRHFFNSIELPPCIFTKQSTEGIGSSTL